MAKEVNLEELRENARTNYGITNAEDLDAETLQVEMDTIDKQATDAEKEEAKVQRNAERAGANSTSASGLGASDGNTNLDDNDEGDLGDQATPLSKQNKDALRVTAEAEGVAVEDADTVAVLREKIQASRDEREAGDEDDDDEDAEDQ